MSYIENIIETAIETGKDLITRNGCRVTPAISFYKFCRDNCIKQPVQDYHFTGVVIIDGDTHIINWAKNGRYMLTGNADHYLDIVGCWEDRPMKIKIGDREINAPYLKQPNYGDMIYSPDVRYSSNHKFAIDAFNYLDTEYSKTVFESGLAFKTIEDAIAANDAIRELIKSQIETAKRGTTQI